MANVNQILRWDPSLIFFKLRSDLSQKGPKFRHRYLVHSVIIYIVVALKLPYSACAITQDQKKTLDLLIINREGLFSTVSLRDSDFMFCCVCFACLPALLIQLLAQTWSWWIHDSSMGACDIGKTLDLLIIIFKVRADLFYCFYFIVFIYYLFSHLKGHYLK